MNLFASAGYLKGSLVASSNAVVFSYVLYLIGKYEYKVSSVELQKIIRKWILCLRLLDFIRDLQNQRLKNSLLICEMSIMQMNSYHI